MTTGPISTSPAAEGIGKSHARPSAAGAKAGRKPRFSGTDAPDKDTVEIGSGKKRSLPKPPSLEGLKGKVGDIGSALKRGLTRTIKMSSPFHRPIKGSAELLMHLLTGGTSLMLLAPKHFLEGVLKVDSLVLPRKFGKTSKQYGGQTLIGLLRGQQK